MSLNITNPPVSDHALVQWLKRRHGFDVEAEREEIARLCRDGARSGAIAIYDGEIMFILRKGCVVTVIAKGVEDVKNGFEVTA